MKILLTTLNSKFIHSNLAIRYLKVYTSDIIDANIREFTINQNLDYIVSEIYKEEVDMVAFSTYIWNLNETLEICEALKIIRPDIKIVLGGPEVSFDGEDLMEEKNFIDFIMYGEGEETYRELTKELIKDQNQRDFSSIKGLIYREGSNKTVKNPARPLMQDLNKIPSPYKVIDKSLKNKVIYYESSRGCPFNCSFCLSSTIKGVRYFDIDRVKEDLGKLIDMEVRQVKFVDRTFNANEEYAKEIMTFIMERNPENINFHFEVTAHLLKDSMLEFISQAKEGLFQFEIGVQSTNDKTIDAIGRVTDFERLSQVTREIKSFNNIHQHLDLIAGLPYEDYDSFRNSFNDVYNLKPEKIQLGFLKLLKGSNLRKEEAKYGYKYLDKPPYEVLENKFMDYGDIIKLKSIEDLVEKYYSGEYFSNSVEYIIRNNYPSPFDFYEDFMNYWQKKKYYKVSHSRDRLYTILKEFIESKHNDDYKIVENLIKYDYIYNHNKKRLPHALKLEDEREFNWNIHDVLKDERLLGGILSRYSELPTRRLLNKVTIEDFDFDVIDLIENDYQTENLHYESTHILFKHKDGEINRCESYNIDEVVRSWM